MVRLCKLALAVIVSSWGCTALAAEQTETPIGKKIENFSLPDIHGKPHALSEYQGKLVVVAFLGTECPLAKTYAPRLKSLAAEFADAGRGFRRHRLQSAGLRFRRSPPTAGCTSSPFRC